MGNRNYVSMNIAIIGTTSIAEKYAMRFSLAGHQVFLAKKDGDMALITPLLSSFENITLCDIEYAAEVADLIYIATPQRDVREVSYWLGDVRRKVIIDLTGNVHAPGDETVNTIAAIMAITGSQHVVKAFDTDGCAHLLKPLFRSPVELVLAGDSRKAKEITKILSLELGIARFFDLGGSETLPLFNEMAKCWTNMLSTQNKVPGFKVVD